MNPCSAPYSRYTIDGARPERKAGRHPFLPIENVRATSRKKKRTSTHDLEILSKATFTYPKIQNTIVSKRANDPMLEPFESTSEPHREKCRACKNNTDILIAVHYGASSFLRIPSSHPGGQTIEEKTNARKLASHTGSTNDVATMKRRFPECSKQPSFQKEEISKIVSPSECLVIIAESSLHAPV
ncbi:hypothetical protein VNO77_31248 [Canavalia gladiata]|uniref:Uncharacterized protein n=1 Tax=Canavalia gladiata TaxID=3824 RepID=A0AAN9Q3X1_CANGL